MDHQILLVHSVVGVVVVGLAVAAIFVPKARRATLYALAVQIAVGISVMIQTGLRPPVLHWALAVLVGGLYSAAKAMERRGLPAGAVRSVLVASAAILLAVYGIGSAAAHGGR